MKPYIKFFLPALMASLFFACDKKDSISYYSNGNAVVLTSSTNSTKPAEANAADTILIYSWDNPKYGTDLATVKYVFQLDLPNGNFSKPVLTRTLKGKDSTKFTASELNQLLFGNGIKFGEVWAMKARVISSYANNNDQKISNEVTVNMTPYAKMPSPASGALFLVGDATQGGWSNPVPVPSQQFTKTDDKHYTGTFTLYGKKEFLILPVNGNWDHKYSVADNAIPYLNEGGSFGYDLSKNFPGPDRDGTYKIDVDFNNGTFTVTQINALTPPSQLFIVGDATAGGWNNPVPVPSQQFTKTSDPNVFEISVALKTGGSYLFLPVNGDWNHKYGGNNPPTPLRGTLYADGDVAGSNTPAPTVSGNYKITVNFSTGKFSLVKQ